MLLYSLQVPNSNNQTAIILPLIIPQDRLLEQDAVGVLVPGQTSGTLEDIFGRKTLNLKQEITDLDVTSISAHHPERIVPKVEGKIDPESFEDVICRPAVVSGAPSPSISKQEARNIMSNTFAPLYAPNPPLRRQTLKLKDTNDSFGYFISQGPTPLVTPPSNKLAASAYPSDLFIHRTVQSDTDQSRHVQIWMLTSTVHRNESSHDGNDQCTWEPAAIGDSMFFSGVERFLGVDLTTGRPYWYSADTFNRWVGRKGFPRRQGNEMDK